MPILTEEERCGTVLANRYRLESILGKGGMGVVYRAEDLHAGSPVAVKILLPVFAQDPAFSKRFVREARAAAAIRHPNVVALLDLGAEPDGTIYQVFELLEGHTLRRHLAARERIEPSRAIELMLPLLDALSCAHERGVVHRDLKPDNVFLARSSEDRVTPKILDFGIAKLADQGSLVTRTGSLMGTPQYMAPEQGRGAREQGPPVDVWAMGIVLFECLAGAPPFTGASPMHVILRVVSERAPRLDRVVPTISASLADVVERALEPSVSHRFASATEFAVALRRAAADCGLDVSNLADSTIAPWSIPPPGPNGLPSASPATSGTSLEVDVDVGEELGNASAEIATVLARLRSSVRTPEVVSSPTLAARTGPPEPPRTGSASERPRGKDRRLHAPVATAALVACAGMFALTWVWCAGPGESGTAAVRAPNASAGSGNDTGAATVPDPARIAPAAPSSPSEASAQGTAAQEPGSAEIVDEARAGESRRGHATGLPSDRAGRGRRDRARTGTSGSLPPSERAPGEQRVRIADSPARDGRLPGVVEW